MKLAAVLYDIGEGAAADALLTSLALRLRRAGFKLAGAVQSNVAVAGRRHSEIVLEDLASAGRVDVSQYRGPLARGCRLDERALEYCAGIAVSSLEPDTDLVVVNRFGKREAEGHGFRLMIEQAVVLGVPVLAGLSRAHLEAWRTFVGEEPVLLPPDMARVASWCVAKVSDRRSKPLYAGMLG